MMKDMLLVLQIAQAILAIVIALHELATIY